MEENKDNYDQFYSDLSDFNESLNYMRKNKKTRKYAINRLIFGFVAGLPTIIFTLLCGIAWPITALMGLVLGISSIDCLRTIIKYHNVHEQASLSASFAYDHKRIIEANEKEFKINLVKSITAKDCSNESLNSVKSRLIDLEYEKENSRRDSHKIPLTKMKLDNEIELVSFLLKSLNRLAPYANQTENENLEINEIIHENEKHTDNTVSM